MSQPKYTLSDMIKDKMGKSKQLGKLLAEGYVIESAKVSFLSMVEEEMPDVGITFTLVDPLRAKEELDNELKDLSFKAAALGYEVILKRVT